MIVQIREIQAPYINGEKPVDVVLVWPVFEQALVFPLQPS